MFKLLTLLLTTLPLLLQNPPNPLPPLALANGEALIFYYVDAPPVIIAERYSDHYGAAWNAAGDLLAYQLDAANARTNIYVSDGERSRLLVNAFVTPGFALSWSPTGDEVIFPINVRGTENGVWVEVYALGLESGALPRKLAGFEFMSGCGAGSYFPATWRYWEETHTVGSRPLLQLTRYGLLYGVTCDGSDTTLLDLNSDHATLLAGGGLSHVSIAPDGRHIIGLQAGRLLLIDLATLESKELPTVMPPDQLAWGAKGDIFYSARAMQENLWNGLSIQKRAAIRGGLGDDLDLIPIYETYLYHLDTHTGTATLLYTGDAFAIGRMAATADGQTLFFSQIPNLNAWANALIEGEISRVKENGYLGAARTTPTKLYALSLVDGRLRFLGNDLRQLTMGLGLRRA